jgi:iron complex outermembrane recepter protein
LNNAIVSRKDSTNAVYYVNAGNTSQKGIEMQSYYDLLSHPQQFISGARLQFSYTHDDFHYGNFKQSTTDFSGKRLPSVAPNTVAFAGDIILKNALYVTLTWFYSDHLPLNDANSYFASAYQLLGAKIGWKPQLKGKVGLHIFAGAENLFNVNYSLGNDINAAGDRYYNPAAGRNYFAGLGLQLH